MLRELGSYILPENSCFCGAKAKTFLKHVLHEVYTTWQTSTRINTSRVNEFVEVCLWEKFKTFQKVNNLSTYEIFFHSPNLFCCTHLCPILVQASSHRLDFLLSLSGFILSGNLEITIIVC